MNLALVALAGYFIGTISFTRIVARLVLPGEDISVTEYEVAGTAGTWTYRGVSATSVLERAGWKWFVGVVVLDSLKAFVPTLAMRLAGADPAEYVTMAAAVIVGHVWPVWWRFVGGRGQSCLLGSLLAIDVLAVPFAAIGGLVIGLGVLTSVYFARNISPLLLVPWFAFTAGLGSELWFAITFNVIYWLAVRGDLAEEWKTRKARGIPAMTYAQRLGLAWRDFFHER